MNRKFRNIFYFNRFYDLLVVKFSAKNWLKPKEHETVKKVQIQFQIVTLLNFRHQYWIFFSSAIKRWGFLGSWRVDESYCFKTQKMTELYIRVESRAHGSLEPPNSQTWIVTHTRIFTSFLALRQCHYLGTRFWSDENVTIKRLYSNYKINLWINFFIHLYDTKFCSPKSTTKNFWIFVCFRLRGIFLEEKDLPEEFIWRIWMKIFVIYCKNL